MNQYFHSIRIDAEKCNGRMKCLRMCPTQAIRVRDGKAAIIEEKCIDCGECITVCPHNAIIPLTDPFGEYLREYKGPKPLISNVCPTIVRLIQVKYPALIDQVIPIDTPRELAAREIKKNKSKTLGLREEDIGITYLTPCPVKMISIKQPAEKKGKSHIDGAIAISDIYGPLLSAMEDIEKRSYEEALKSICILGIGWAMVGGICRTLRLKNSLAVSGLNEVLKVFDDMERGGFFP